MMVAIVVMVSVCWVLSRLVADNHAWKNDYIDGFIGIVAIISWIVNTIGVIYNPQLDYIAVHPLESLIALILGVLMYILLTWIFVKIRYFVYFVQQEEQIV